jgi:hypothetical protein
MNGRMFERPPSSCIVLIETAGTIMSEDPKTLGEIMEGIVGKRTPEEEIASLQRSISTMRAQLDAKVNEERNRRYDIERRTSRIEATVNLIVQIGFVALGAYGFTKLQEYWGDGNVWGVIAIVTGAIVVFSLVNDAMRVRKPTN